MLLKYAALLAVLSSAASDNEDHYLSLNVVAGERSTLDAVVKITDGWGHFCTATLVGENVIITAAHCIYFPKEKLHFTYGGEVYDATPYGHPKWRGEDAHGNLLDGYEFDVALAIVDRPVKNAKPWNVSPTEFNLNIPQSIQFAGFGCTDSNNLMAESGLQRIGSARVTSVSEYTITATSKDRKVGAGSRICFGDSGGPSFLVSSGGQVTQVGINSRARHKLGESYFTNINGFEIKNFIRTLVEKYSLKMCGFNYFCESKF